MKAIDRVMRAYQRTRKLTDEDASLVRAELSKFIDELMLGKKSTIAEPKNERSRPIKGGFHTR